MTDHVERPLTDLVSAKHPERPLRRVPPAGVTDAQIEAAGKVSEALEAVEAARGELYAFHRLCGRADLLLQEGVELLRNCGEPDLADTIDEVLIGRDVIADMWSFELVESYDAQYWQPFRDVESTVRHTLMGGVRHVHEATMKKTEQQR